MTDDRKHARELHEQEERIRQKVDEGERPDKAVAEEMREEMHDKSPWKAVKDDAKAVKEDLKDWLSKDDDEDERPGS